MLFSKHTRKLHTPEKVIPAFLRLIWILRIIGPVIQALRYGFSFIDMKRNQSGCSHAHTVLVITFSFFPTVSTKYPLAQKCLFPYLYFKFACLSNIINVDLLFKYPIISDNGYLVVSLVTCEYDQDTPHLQ